MVFLTTAAELELGLSLAESLPTLGSFIMRNHQWKAPVPTKVPAPGYLSKEEEGYMLQGHEGYSLD